ncbi:AAA family ATPase [Trichlorobacter lovleyi]|uniref:AAA family ATPase n=1 Tax=Trichlorobacter lovleyi TaxID=313985 RepID=UPI003D0AE93A
MIVSFSIENFRSFAGEETFSLVASNRFAGHHEGHAVSIPGGEERVLRTAVLYGANGAGKSNLFKALNFVRTMALNTRGKNSGTGRESFRFGDEIEKPSIFDLCFLVNDKLYRFGFKIDDHRIVEEWLVQIDGKREKELYERVTSADDKVTIETKGLKKAGSKLTALATVGGPPNQTFLATVRAMLSTSDYGIELTNVINWFEDSLTLIRPDSPFLPLGQLLAQDTTFLQFASEFLKASSTGVDHLDISKKELTEDQLRSMLPEQIFTDIINEINEDGEKAVVSIGEGSELLVERTGENHYFHITIQAAHEHKAGRVISLKLVDESDGTQRLLQLIPALHHLKTSGGVFVIDEIDRSMHPMLTIKFLEFFLKCCEGEQRQIIVTTHESNLLDLDLLRRDEIWFVEKDKEGATRLYSLSEFKVRKDLEIRKHYLQGRFGAVPFLGTLDRLLEEEASV